MTSAPDHSYSTQHRSRSSGSEIPSAGCIRRIYGDRKKAAGTEFTDTEYLILYPDFVPAAFFLPFLSMFPALQAGTCPACVIPDFVPAAFFLPFLSM